MFRDQYIQQQLTELLRRCKCSKIRVIEVAGTEPDLTQTNTYQQLEGGEGDTVFVACDGTVLNFGVVVEVEQGLSMGSPIKLGDDAAGTTEPGIFTSSRHINLNGFPLVFVGADDTNSADGVQEARITITPEGVIEFNKQHFENQSEPYYIKIYPNDIENVATFNFTNTSNNDIQDAITRNLESFVFGWNVAPGGSRENSNYSMLGISMEYNWDAAGLGLTDEWHILHTTPGVGGVARRPISYILPHNDLDQWGVTSQITVFSLQYPGAINDAPYYRIHYYDASTEIVQEILDPTSTNGVTITTDIPNKTYTIANTGMGADSIVDVSSFSFARFDMIAVGTQEVPLADLTVMSKIGAYRATTTTALSPIGGSLYLGDVNYYTSLDFDQAPGLSAVYNSVQTGATDLAFYYSFNGSRVEGARLYDGKFGIGTIVPGNKLTVEDDDDDTIPGLGTNGGKLGIFRQVAGAAVYGLIGGQLGTGNFFFQVQRVDGTATAYNMLLQPSGGNVGINTTDPQAKLHVDGSIRVDNLSTFADDAAAGAGGLTAGRVYKTAAGELRIKT